MLAPETHQKETHTFDYMVVASLMQWHFGIFDFKFTHSSAPFQGRSFRKCEVLYKGLEEWQKTRKKKFFLSYN